MSGISAYKENSITTQSREGLIVLLYDGAIKFLKQALEAIEAGDVAAKGELIGKASDIIIELDSVLDIEAGGEIAANLQSLYDWMLTHLNTANTSRNPHKIRDVIARLEDLNEAWKAVTS